MKSFVCIGSGPSLTLADCELVRAWRDRGPDRKVIAVNLSFQIAPWSDIYYATDLHFFDRHYETMMAMKEDYTQLWSVNTVSKHPGVHVMPDNRDSQGRRVNDWGSGMKAVRLAEHLGAERVALVGYDFGSDADGNSHWHAPHEPPFVNHASFGTAPRSEFRMPVFQCSRRSVECRANHFPRLALEDFLQDGQQVVLERTA